jgi:hypothetical protein
MTSRAARRRDMKAARKSAKHVGPAPQTINLENPQAQNYSTWIIGNSFAWQARALAEIEGHVTPEVYAELVKEFTSHRPSGAYAESKTFHDGIEAFAAERYVIPAGSAKGQHIVIAGAGPSLNQTAAEFCPGADQVWGCNSALTWLADHGHRVTHGFTVDQTPHMCAEWATAPDVEYLLASTVHPHLVDLLVSRDRRYRHFHNFVGIKRPPVQWADDDGSQRTMGYEEWLYCLLYPPTLMAGSGLNAVTRAIDVAQHMGAEKITVLGADCCLQMTGPSRIDLPFGSPEHLTWLREHTVMHADGGHALASEATAITMGATIDGRYWLTKPDLVITTQWLVRMAHASDGQIELKGDTLPVALYDKDESFWKRMPNFQTADGRIAAVPLMNQVPVTMTTAAA